MKEIEDNFRVRGVSIFRTETETLRLFLRDHSSFTRPSSAQSSSLAMPVANFSTRKPRHTLMGRKLGRNELRRRVKQKQAPPKLWNRRGFRLSKSCLQIIRYRISCR